MTPDEWTPEFRYEVARLLTRRIARLGTMVESVMCNEGSWLCLPRRREGIEEEVGFTMKKLQEGVKWEDVM